MVGMKRLVYVVASILFAWSALLGGFHTTPDDLVAAGLAVIAAGYLVV